MSWRFARTPKWIVRHVAVVLLVTAMILLLLWQVSRLHQKQDYKALVEHRQELPAEPVEQLVPAGAKVGDAAVDGVLYRTASATGTYDDAHTVTVENRSSPDGSPGGWVLTPLELGDGRVLLVNRGFIELDAEGRVVAPPARTGTVRVTGLLFPSQHRGHFGAKDPTTGMLHVVARVDLQRIAEQVDGALIPTYLQLSTSEPGEPAAAKGAPAVEPLGPPSISEGPHFSYAVQWGIFSAIAVVGYGLLLRKVALEQGRLEAADDEEEAAEEAADEADTPV